MKCIFCDQDKMEVAAMVAREDNSAVVICNECISLCLAQLAGVALKPHAHFTREREPSPDTRRPA